VTGDHVDVIVTWNAQRSDGSTLEGEYEATIGPGTLTGSTHDVANPGPSKTSWTASDGPAKDCRAGSAPSPAPSPEQTEKALLEALSGHADLSDALVKVARLAANASAALDYGNDLATDFEVDFPADDDLLDLVEAAGFCAALRNADGTYVSPVMHALLPVILRMSAHVATLLTTDPRATQDPQTAHTYRTAIVRLMAVALGDALTVHG